MYILDSDVLTVIDGSRRNRNVMAWYATLDETDIFLTVTTIFDSETDPSARCSNVPPGCSVTGIL